MEQIDGIDNTFSQLFYKHVYEPLFGYCMNLASLNIKNQDRKFDLPKKTFNLVKEN